MTTSSHEDAQWHPATEAPQENALVFALIAPGTPIRQDKFQEAQAEILDIVTSKGGLREADPLELWLAQNIGGVLHCCGVLSANGRFALPPQEIKRPMSRLHRWAYAGHFSVPPLSAEAFSLTRPAAYFVSSVGG